jgi:hypothetical protein
LKAQSEKSQQLKEMFEKIMKNDSRNQDSNLHKLDSQGKVTFDHE